MVPKGLSYTHTPPRTNNFARQVTKQVSMLWTSPFTKITKLYINIVCKQWVKKESSTVGGFSPCQTSKKQFVTWQHPDHVPNGLNIKIMFETTNTRCHDDPITYPACPGIPSGNQTWQWKRNMYECPLHTSTHGFPSQPRLIARGVSPLNILLLILNNYAVLSHDHQWLSHVWFVYPILAIFPNTV